MRSNYGGYGNDEDRYRSRSRRSGLDEPTGSGTPGTTGSQSGSADHTSSGGSRRGFDEPIGNPPQKAGASGSRRGDEDFGWGAEKAKPTQLEPKSRTAGLDRRGKTSQLQTKGSWFGNLLSKLTGGSQESKGEVAKHGAVTLTGTVVSYQQRNRRPDFFHVLFDTVVNGAPMTFSPICQVMTVELNESDYTQLDSRSRRTVVVNMMGRVYDGAVRERDTVSVKGSWTKHHTINASRVKNLSNGSDIAMSHSVPAGVVRFITFALLAGLVALIVWICTGANTSGGASSGGSLKEFFAYVVLAAAVVWLLCGLLRPSLRTRYFMAKLRRIIIGILIGFLLWKLWPEVFFIILVIAIMLWGIKIMFTGRFR